MLEKHPEHAQCRAALEESEAPFTDAHALAETFATLTGFYKVPTAAAAELTLGLKSSLTVEALPLTDYETATTFIGAWTFLSASVLRFDRNEEADKNVRAPKGRRPPVFDKGVCVVEQPSRERGACRLVAGRTTKE